MKQFHAFHSKCSGQQWQRFTLQTDLCPEEKIYYAILKIRLIRNIFKLETWEYVRTNATES